MDVEYEDLMHEVWMQEEKPDETPYLQSAIGIEASFHDLLEDTEYIRTHCGRPTL